MKKITITSALLLGTLSSFSQDQLKYSWGGRFHLVNEDGFRVKKNLNKKEMLSLLDDNRPAIDLYRQYRVHNNLSKGLMWATCGTAVAGLGLMAAGIEWGEGEITNETLFWSGLGLEGLTILLGGTSIGFAISAKVKGYKLSAGYNKHQERYSLNFGATKHGLGLVLKF